ncbi:S-layer protein domain-containing protein [Methanohalophilus halophilus]|uniref:S-layer family duplication domain-containing protein n=1 Tax=Methanohalophilus halophilus TaxID=2177 RepID=A0A1L3Q0Q1_9EURY|nr:S-layer protein domain-containing protein [Methanohalophilus halophilus]APH38361.1 S-layer protein [Methanohalophilus halophilus]RNI10769.1 S-layer protein [Methanohalophilus halophilus]SDW04055.1 S-layer family duplication domain-containing protein [Methanohalophilus halophilus]
MKTGFKLIIASLLIFGVVCGSASAISSVSNLNESDTGTTWINWTWDNPAETNFSNVSVYIDGTFEDSVTDQFYNATGLDSDKEYEISTRAVDNGGNLSEWNNDTATTDDIIPPASINNLNESNVGLEEITWSWDNPLDSDFDYVMIYLNDTWQTNTSSESYTNSSLDPGSDYEISTHTVDTSGNINSTWVNDTATTLSPDSTPPASIKDLDNTTSEHWIRWSWTNPSDSDFNHTEIYFDGVFEINSSNPEYNATGLDSDTSYDISIRTVDTSGNVNSTWVNQTSTTNSDTTPPSPVSSLSAAEVGTTWIKWTWDNPSDGDFNHTEIYFDGVFEINSSNSEYNATDLDFDTEYTIEVKTVDTSGNVNENEVSNTTTTHSATYEWGNRIWEEGNQSTTYTWDGRSFSGFYYDLDTGDTSETMEITIDASNREIKEGKLNYITKPIPKDFEQDAWGGYQIIGFMAERYFAGYDSSNFGDGAYTLSLMSDGILSKVLLDTDDDESIYSGSSLTLEEGYSLNIKQVDVNGDSVWISLTQDGDEVDDAILSSDETYVYEKDLGGVDDVPIIVVHIDDVFSGTETNAVFIDGIFQISDDYVEIDEGDEFGEMEIDNVGANEIKMLNEDDINLDEGDIIDIMGKLKFIVADDDVLRFAPFVDMSEPGTYELRGTIAEDEGFIWTPLNFEGFYYDIDEGLSSESLTVKYDGRSIDEGNLTYEATPVSVDFEYNNWGKYNVIGFMAEKYFAGYDDSDFGDETYDSDLMSNGQLSKVLIDDDDEKSVYTGSSLILEEGYALSIREIDVNGDRVMIQLTQDGDNIESAIVSSDDEYVYEKDLGSEDDVPIIVVHFDEIFSGTETSAVFVEGIFQISEDYLEVEDGDDFGVMTVESTSDSIVLENEDDIDLDEGDTIDIMGEIKFKVADSNEVRYYPFVEVETEPAESLDIDIEPTTVVEGEEITFTVTSRGASIRDASILIDGDRVGTTSNEGVFEYDADDAGKFTATAQKEGYVSSKGNFEVISPDDESKKISIEVSPEEVFEGTPITISVVKAIGSEPLEDAEVFFDGQSLGETDEDGTITYNPKEPGTHKLEAKADGYLDAELNIKVNELAANFEFSNLRIDPLPATAGEEFTVMLDSINTGNAEGSYTVELSINDNVTDSQEITLGQNNSTTIEFTSTAGEPGTYLVKAGGLSTTMDVEEGTSIVWYVLGGILLVVGGGAAYVFATGGTAKFAEIAESLRSMLGR